MAEQYVSGDLVGLKSGGPKMTVKGNDKRSGSVKPDHYECQWFGGKKLESGFFHGDSLKRVTEEETK